MQLIEQAQAAGIPVITTFDPTRLLQVYHTFVKPADHHIDVSRFRKNHRLQMKPLWAAIESMANQLGIQRLIVLPGLETGVNLAFSLNSLKAQRPKGLEIPVRWEIDLGLLGHKKEFLKHLADHGFMVPISESVSSIEEARRVVEKHHFFQVPGFEVAVLKLDDSAAGMGITFSNTLAKLEANLQKTFDSKSLRGDRNKSALIQQYLGDAESAVQGIRFSFKGKTYIVITDVLEYSRFKILDGPGAINVPDVRRVVATQGKKGSGLHLAMAQYGARIVATLPVNLMQFHIEAFTNPYNRPDVSFDYDHFMTTDGNMRGPGSLLSKAAALATGGFDVNQSLIQLLKDPDQFLKQFPVDPRLSTSDYEVIIIPTQKSTYHLTISNFTEGAKLNPYLISKLKDFGDKVKAEGGEFFYDFGSNKPGQVVPTSQGLMDKLGVVIIAFDSERLCSKWAFEFRNRFPLFAPGAPGSMIPMPLLGKPHPWEKAK